MASPSSSHSTPPVGTAIQVAADQILALVQDERDDASYSARQQLYNLQQSFERYQADIHAAHLLLTSKLAGAQYELRELTHTFAEYHERTEGRSVDISQQPALQQSLALTKIERDELRAKLAIATREAELRRFAAEVQGSIRTATQQKSLEDFKAGLERFGIIYQSDPCTISFGEMWGSLLTELGIRELGNLTPVELKVTLESLTDKLLLERSALEEMDAKLKAAQHDRQRSFQRAEVEIANLRLRVATLEGAHNAKGVVSQNSEHYR